MKDETQYGSGPCTHTRDRRESDMLKALDDAWIALDHLYDEGQNLPVAIHDAVTRSRLMRERVDPAEVRARRPQVR
jgi:hypothetical protein